MDALEVIDAHALGAPPGDLAAAHDVEHGVGAVGLPAKDHRLLDVLGEPGALLHRAERVVGVGESMVSSGVASHGVVRPPGRETLPRQRS